MSKHTVDACSGAMGCERDVPEIKMKRTAFQVAIEDVQYGLCRSKKERVWRVCSSTQEAT
jgi:hypothetical protein